MMTLLKILLLVILSVGCSLSTPNGKCENYEPVCIWGNQICVHTKDGCRQCSCESVNPPSQSSPFDINPSFKRP